MEGSRTGCPAFLSKFIVIEENIGEEEKEFISIIAILHDIGAVEAQKNTVLLMVSIKNRKDQK